MMSDASKKHIRFSYYGKCYNVTVESRSYADIITAKVLIGHIRLWLILQNNACRLISDMPICSELKEIIFRKIGSYIKSNTVTTKAARSKLN
ncbi:hypothetical protein [Mucilaginibacter pallidiroseus]|uniref:hypothetical protein n=1 Tax=Mucilaginibacter pallidiroseus TaxID=2599295 RepID=UPI0011B52970|nr:hypothetical protein [Mucilaginibacter pallidiroseus]